VKDTSNKVFYMQLCKHIEKNIEKIEKKWVSRKNDRYGFIISMQNTSSNTVQIGSTTQSVFGLRCNDNDICLLSPTIYKSKEKVTVSFFEFMKRLNDKIGEFIDSDFDWSNIIIAGGLISGMLETQPNSAEYETSDIDIFVYGTEFTIRNKIQEIYNYFVNKLDKKFYAFVYKPNTPIINIIMPGKCSFQIIGTHFKNSIEILKSFDLTHCQVGFDGLNLVHTDEFIEAVKTRTTKITKNSIHAYRLVKTYNRGYSIRRPDYCYVRNIFHEYTSKPGDTIPSNTDKFYDINNLSDIIEELSKNPIVIQNLTKNYIPETDSKLSVEEEMEKIGTLYAGKNQYEFINDCGHNVYKSDIKAMLIFTRMPFLC